LKQTPRFELLESLKDVHGGGSPMTSNIARKVVAGFQSGESSTANSKFGKQRVRKIFAA